MEAVKKVASGAVESIRNSPLFRRKFGTYQKAATRSDSEEGEGERGEVPQPLSPEKDRTPFVQGFYFQVDYLDRQEVDAGCAQDHGCIDEAVGQLCREGRLVRQGGTRYILYSTCSSYSTKSVISTITDQNHKW